jgi:glyoxylase-like metal-dependent hydrolase (beta-lactamase superfamily II)
MTKIDMTRRALLAGSVASLAAGAALAKAPMIGKPAPAFHRFKVGAFELTVISDGPLVLGPPSGDVFKGLSKEAMTAALNGNFLPTQTVEMEQNILVVNTGDHVVLFDTGTGPTVKAFGPYAGRLLANLEAAGIDPKSVDVIALTHAHPDHCFGIMTDKGARNFPNAKICMTQADFDFFTDEAKMSANDMMKMMIGGARHNLMPNRDRITFVKDGQEVVPGIMAISAPGHTVGHTCFGIQSQGQKLINLGDAAHHHIISLETPRLPFAFDTDGAQGVASRLKMWDMLASERIPMVAYHFPFPGLGYVGKQGDAYRYFPAQLRTVL